MFPDGAAGAGGGIGADGSDDSEDRAGVLVLVTCEHGGNEVPARYAALFAGAAGVLAGHRGLDIGALGVAQRLAARLAAPLVCSTVTRLVVDLNRSVGRADLFSEFTRDLPGDERERILAEHYRPHREGVERLVSIAVAAHLVVVHIGVHSCVDELDGRRRELDVALLFDEDRPGERALCEAWRGRLLSLEPGLRCPFNEPYRGADDGLTTSLRVRFGGGSYLGIEVELRQGLLGDAAARHRYGDLLADALGGVVGTGPGTGLWTGRGCGDLDF